MLGIESAAPGFRKVRIAPHLGPLKDLEGSIPHPRGEIRVSLKREGTGMRASVDLADGVDGTFVWNGSEHPIKAGRNSLQLR
jgi:hypothetical protein